MNVKRKSRSALNWVKWIGFALLGLVAYLGVLTFAYYLFSVLMPDGLYNIAASMTANAVTAAIVITWRVVEIRKRKVDPTFQPILVESKKRHDDRMVLSDRKKWFAFAVFALSLPLFKFATTTISTWVKNTINDQAFAARQFGSMTLMLIVAFTLLLAPIGEEALMRGFIYPMLRHVLPVGWSIAIVTLIFAFLHGNWTQITLTIPFGVLITYIYERTQSLTCAVLTHVWFNLSAMFVDVFVPKHATVPMLCLAIAATCVIMAALMYYLESITRSKTQLCSFRLGSSEPGL